MKKSMVVGVIVGLHVVVVGSLLLIQGCGTSKPAAPSPSTSQPVMPPVTATPVPTVPATEIPAVSEPVVPAPAPAPVVKAEPKVYVVKQGDALARIAMRFNVSVKDIMALNQLKSPNKIRPGQKLVLPDYVDMNAPEPKHKAPAKKKVAKAKPAAASGGEYVVKSGDMLSSIAYRNGTTVKAIKEANNLTSDNLKVGQKLAIPHGGKAKVAEGAEQAVPAVSIPVNEAEAAPAVTEPPSPLAPMPSGGAGSSSIIHMVEPGQDLNAVAMMYNVRVDELMKLNNLANAQVRTGQTLKIPAAAE